MKTIDLRSDTVTRPTAAMRAGARTHGPHSDRLELPAQRIPHRCSRRPKAVISRPAPAGTCGVPAECSSVPAARTPRAREAVESIVAEGVEKSMTKFNRRAPGLNIEEA